MVLSWLSSNTHPSLDSYIKNGEAQSSGGSADMRILLKPYSCRRFDGESLRSTQMIHNDIGHSPVDGLHLWHGAIRKDLISLLEELYQSRSSSDFSNLDRIVVRLKFLADIITFYR